MNKLLRLAVSLSIGCVLAIVITKIATVAALRFWPDYAAASPSKAYSFVMLVSRLAVGAAAVAAGASVATVIARDNGTAAWLLGAISLAISLPIHLYSVWADYPVWYHVVYLGYLVPLAGLAGRMTRRRSA